MSFDTKYLGELTQLMKMEGSKILPLAHESLHESLDSARIPYGQSGLRRFKTLAPDVKYIFEMGSGIFR